MQKPNEEDMSTITGGKKICLLDLNYTLVSNQRETRLIRPFSRRMQAEEYRVDLIEAIKDDYVIIITARPNYQMKETLENVFRKTGWRPQEYYFNDINADPPTFKESALRRFVFPKHGDNPAQFYAVESNPKTRAMYAGYGIGASPYDTFIKTAALRNAMGEQSAFWGQTARVMREEEPEAKQMSLFDMM